MALYFLKVDILDLHTSETGEARNLRTLSIDETHDIDGVTYDTSLISRDDISAFVENGERELPPRRLVLTFPTPEQADAFLHPVGTLRCNISLMKRK